MSIVMNKMLLILPTTYLKQFKSSKSKQTQFEIDYLILHLSWVIYVFTLFAKKWFTKLNLLKNEIYM